MTGEPMINNKKKKILAYRGIRKVSRLIQAI
jgi:hypothetical protein